ncbi:MAG TPA: hypothetical protein VMK12_17645 [Anaeromyxobacteraceae bacterium]|nr:hypothetical protein [Anaeromyxobacteraceae bacterium]
MQFYLVWLRWAPGIAAVIETTDLSMAGSVFGLGFTEAVIPGIPSGRVIA